MVTWMRAPATLFLAVFMTPMLLSLQLAPGALCLQGRRASAMANVHALDPDLEEPPRIGQLCDIVPGKCTPLGWLPKDPFPLHPINGPCCVAIRSAGLKCLCLLQTKWRVPKKIVDNYVKDCKLPPKLTCSQTGRRLE